MTTPVRPAYRVADRLAQSIAQAGVNTLFSLSGNQVMPVYDALIDLPIRLVHTRHEAAAVFMAEAWSRACGQIGVALVTAGPGFGNALGALYSASMSEVPVILLSGDSPSSQDGMGAFQQFDQVTAASPFVKASMRLGREEDVAEVFALAAGIALGGVPGPVHIALPFDTLNQALRADRLPSLDQIPSHSKRRATQPSPEQVESIAAELRNAHRPLILVGPHLGRNGYRDDLQNLTRATGAPVVVLDSPRGLRDPSKGAFTELVGAADCVFYLGKPVDFTTGMGAAEVVAARRIIVVSELPSVLEQADSLLADRLVIAEKINPAALIRKLTSHAATRPLSRTKNDAAGKWLATAESALRHRVLANMSDNDAASKRLVDIVNEAVADHPGSIVICDGGEIGQWAQGFINAETMITNGPSGAIGASLPYAIGAQLARPDARVIALMGDGTAGFHLAEFETAARESLGITVVIGNDSRWNAEHHIQLTHYGEDRTMGCTLSQDVRYDLVAGGLGCHGEYITGLSQLPARLDTALDAGQGSSRPTCLNVIIPGAPAPVYQALSL